jgi:hypothetical protein
VKREEWEAAWRATFERLRDGGLGPIEAQRKAREMTTERHGPQPSGPPLWMRIGLKFLQKKLAGYDPAKGGGVDFSFVKSMKKGVQGVAEAAFAIGLVAGVDRLLSSVDEAVELEALGMPAVYAGVTLLVVRIAVNYWKVKRASLAAGKLRG